MNKPGILIIGILVMQCAYAQVSLPFDLTKILRVPLQYTVLKIADHIDIDGKDDEKIWKQANWTEDFTDIETGSFTGMQNRTRCRMLWDDTCLYVYMEARQANLWATLTGHDSPVFQDDAFEIFICPDGNNFNYVEFQINGFETVWDLFLPKPYRNGGKGLTNWDIKGLKKAVRLNGTINNPNDVDSGWSVELAIPLKAVMMNGERPPAVGSIWRMNFSSVQWEPGIVSARYERRVNKLTGEFLPPHYSVWSPHGVLDLHYPERWGYILFSDTPQTKRFLSDEEENLKLSLWKYYYLQQQFKKTNKKYAGTLAQLKDFFANLNIRNNRDEDIRMDADNYQFRISGHLPGVGKEWAIDDTGEFQISSKPL